MSKIFHAINRFSEDIDLAVDYAALGFIGDRDPRRADISNTRRNNILTDMMIECRKYITGEFLRALRSRCEEILGKNDTWGLDVSERDPNLVRFIYPTSTTKSLAYVVPHVVLELGTHAEFVPHDRFTIRSLVAEEFPALFTDVNASVIALLAKRTFWEKATILHAEYYRPSDKALPERYARHYYDVAMLAQSPTRSEALADMPLLAQVVKHKMTFYPCGWARYDLASSGTLRLSPAGQRLAALERDYRNMAVMIFGEPPKFDNLMEALAALEREINDEINS